MSLVLELGIIELMCLAADLVGEVLAAACDLARYALCFHHKNSESAEYEVIYLAGLVVQREISVVYYFYMVRFAQLFEHLTYLPFGSSALALALAEVYRYVQYQQ